MRCFNSNEAENVITLTKESTFLSLFFSISFSLWKIVLNSDKCNDMQELYGGGRMHAYLSTAFFSAEMFCTE